MPWHTIDPSINAPLPLHPKFVNSCGDLGHTKPIHEWAEQEVKHFSKIKL